MNQDRHPRLVLTDVGVTYRGAEPVHALRPLTAAVSAGEMVAVVGRSGSGKSTLLNVLGLLERPTCGRYLVEGVDVGGLDERTLTALRGAYFGFVFQANHLLIDRTVRENTELPLLYRRSTARERSARALEALDRVGMRHRQDALPGTLSGGERQRVSIARALAQGPRVLLCDEPTGALDRANAATVFDLLVGLNRDGLTVIVVTHDEASVTAVGRRWRLDDGHVTEEVGGTT